MRVHAIELGWLQFPKGWTKARGALGIVRAIVRGKGGPPDRIPMVGYVVEHDDGHIVIDSGAQSAAVRDALNNPRLRRFFEAHCEPDDEIGPQMRERGLDPEDVRFVMPTHIDADHAGGVGHFPNAQVLVHRTEWDNRNRLSYRWRCQPKTWPAWVIPKLYDLVDEPYGPFDRSLPLTDGGDILALPTPGHSHGHVGIALRTKDLTVFFGGDHILRQSWYAADLSRGVSPANVYPRLTADTNRRLRKFIERFPTLLLPSHDAEAAQNIARWEPLKI